MTFPRRRAGGHRRRPGARTALSALGVFAAAAMLGTAVTVAFSLQTGFSRAADRADLPDVIAHFRPRPRSAIDRRVRALPDLAARGYRLELDHTALRSGGHRAADGRAIAMPPTGRRGYAIVAGRDLSPAPGEVVVERGLAGAWHLRPGGRLAVGDLGEARVVGVAVAPDDVAYPLTPNPRVWVPRATVAQRLGPRAATQASALALWVRDRARLPETLVQARATSYGIDDLRFATRAGVQTLVGQAVALVTGLLVAVSIVALAAAAAMLAGSAHGEVQRRLAEIGVRRALGASRARIAGGHAVAAALVAAPAAALGLGLGALAAAGPIARLLETLDELPPGAALAGPLAVGWAAVVALVALPTGWPAWRATRRPPVELLRGAELGEAPRRGGRARLPGGLGWLGARLVAARRARWTGTVAVVGTSAAVVLVLLGVASFLHRLQADPGALGKRYQLTAALPADRAAAARRLAGVAAAAPRYETQAIDSFALGETIDLIGYPGDHTAFESPPLAAGRRARGPREAEVGLGLAQALGVAPGGTLAVQLPSGREQRYRVAGVVRALGHEGRVAYVDGGRLAAADPGAPERLAIRLAPGASPAAVERRLAALAPPPARPPGRSVARRPGPPGAHAASPPAGPPARHVASPASGATAHSGGFLGVLATVLRVVAGVDAAVCVYALAQGLALTARERRGTLSVLRACGAGPGTIAWLLAGAAAVVVLPAAILAVALERFVLAPAVARLAAAYVELPLHAGAGAVAAVIVGLGALGLAAAATATRRVAREPVVAGLHEL